jgi:two-component system, NtrC family, sensor histidine kinase HydH
VGLASAALFSFVWFLQPESLSDLPILLLERAPGAMLHILFLALTGFVAWELASANRTATQQALRTAEDLAAANRSLQEARGEVQRSERVAALGQLSAGLAHELRNPLSTIRSSAEMIARQPAPEMARELSGYITEEADRASSIVTRFLEFARPLKLRISPTDLNDVLDKGAGQLRLMAEQKQINFVRSYAPDLPAIPLDAELVERVVVNLLSNAVQASPIGADVTMRTRWQPGSVEFSVVDRGPGVPPENRENIFNPFFTTRPDGTGLGLAIVSRIVEEHGGTVSVESDSGACFRVVLPVKI